MLISDDVAPLLLELDTLSSKRRKNNQTTVATLLARFTKCGLLGTLPWLNMSFGKADLVPAGPSQDEHAAAIDDDTACGGVSLTLAVGHAVIIARQG